MKFNSLYLAKNVTWILVNCIALLAFHFINDLLKAYVRMYEILQPAENLYIANSIHYGTMFALFTLLFLSNNYFFIWANKK